MHNPGPPRVLEYPCGSHVAYGLWQKEDGEPLCYEQQNRHFFYWRVTTKAVLEEDQSGSTVQNGLRKEREKSKKTLKRLLKCQESELGYGQLFPVVLASQGTKT